MVLTQGEALPTELAAQGLARLVPPEDPTAVAAVLRDYLAEPADARAERQAAAHALAERWRWSQVAEPLRSFTRHPALAADRQAAAARPPLDMRLLPKAWHSLRTRGAAGLLRDIQLYLKR